jgi:hypothetical protein
MMPTITKAARKEKNTTQVACLISLLDEKKPLNKSLKINTSIITSPCPASAAAPGCSFQVDTLASPGHPWAPCDNTLHLQYHSLVAAHHLTLPSADSHRLISGLKNCMSARCMFLSRMLRHGDIVIDFLHIIAIVDHAQESLE